jgi:NAD(P)-dependent dehydrogenase (short-subunit alcohol dehydrogenase family)
MRIFDSASADGGVVSVIVNNASYFQYDRPEAPDVNILKRSIDVHITAPVLVFECAIEKMNAEAGMTIVNILDQKVENINPDYYSYTIGKFALYGITQMWQAMPTPNLRVFGILPGLMLKSGKQTEDNFQIAKGDNLLERAPTTSDLCEMIEYLVNARGVPGQNIALDSGARLMRRLRDVAFVHDRAGELDRSRR